MVLKINIIFRHKFSAV